MTMIVKKKMNKSIYIRGEVSVQVYDCKYYYH